DGACMQKAFAIDLLVLDLEQARQLSRVWCQHGCGSPRGELVGSARVSVEPIGVEHERKPGGARQLARKLARSLAAPQPWPENERAGARRQLQHGAGAVAEQRPLVRW